jgi:recombination associated protein RdgC
MWFRNLQIYRLTPAWKYSTEALESALQRGAFAPCGQTDRNSRGWVSPRESGQLVFSVNGHQVISLGVEEKLLPAAIVRQHAAVKAAEIEKVQGYKAGRKQMREIREGVELELLTRALAQRSRTYVWIDQANRWLVVDTASATRADAVIETLKLTLDELPLALVKTALSPAAAMTAWLARGDAPGRFSIDRDGELQAAAEERAAVRYTRHNLDSDEVRAHIAAGKSVTRLALTWNDRISFVLLEDLQVRRVAFLDLLKEEADRQADNADDLFGANVSIMSGELAAMLADLVASLGGEGEDAA